MKIYAADNSNIINDPEAVFEFFEQYCGKNLWVRCYNLLYHSYVWVRPRFVDQYGDVVGNEITDSEMSEVNCPDQNLQDILYKISPLRVLYSHRYEIDPSNVVTLTTKELCSNYPESLDTQFDRYAGKDLWVYVVSSQNRYNDYWLRILEVKDGVIKYNVIDSYYIQPEDILEQMDDEEFADVAAFTVVKPVEVLSTEELVEFLSGTREF